jgi:hypothetical protein
MVMVNIAICLPPGILILPQEIMVSASTMILPPIVTVFEGRLEVKLPTISTDVAAEVGGVREEKK